jgi:hypothetical protein
MLKDGSAGILRAGEVNRTRRAKNRTSDGICKVEELLTVVADWRFASEVGKTRREPRLEME